MNENMSSLAICNISSVISGFKMNFELAFNYASLVKLSDLCDSF